MEVIADDRLPANHHTSTIDQRARRTYHKRLERFREKEILVRDQIAAGTRHRREELKNLYMKSKGTTDTNLSTQAKVWELYSNNLTPTQILKEGLSSTCNIDLKGKYRPRFFDFYKIVVFAVVPVGMASFITMIGLLRSLLILRLDIDVQRLFIS